LNYFIYFQIKNVGFLMWCKFFLFIVSSHFLIRNSKIFNLLYIILLVIIMPMLMRHVKKFKELIKEGEWNSNEFPEIEQILSNKLNTRDKSVYFKYLNYFIWNWMTRNLMNWNESGIGDVSRCAINSESLCCAAQFRNPAITNYPSSLLDFVLN